MRVLFITSWAFAGAVVERILHGGRELAGLVTHPSTRPPIVSMRRALWDGPSALAARRWMRSFDINRTIQSMAADPGTPCFQRDDLEAPGLIEDLRSLMPDCVLVMGWPRILGGPILEGLGPRPINAHPSMLPGHRGPNPFSSTIRTGEGRTGWTFHLMTEAPDAGEILLQRSIPIRQGDDGLTLQIRLCRLACEMAPELLDGLERGELVPRAQEEEASWFPALSERDRPVEWTRPASFLCDQVRSLFPWTTATTTWKGRTLHVDRCRVVAGKTASSRPGRVTGITARGLIVTAGEGTVWIGGLRFAGISFARSQLERWRAIRVGDLLGES